MLIGAQINELILKKLLSTEKNQIKLFNNLSYSMYPARAMSVTLEEVKTRKGSEYLRALGYKTGKAGVDHVRDEMRIYEKMLPDRLKDIKVTLTILGFGIIDDLDLKEKSVAFSIPSHPVIGPAIERYGSEAGAISFYEGLFAAFINEWFQFPTDLSTEVLSPDNVLMRGEKRV